MTIIRDREEEYIRATQQEIEELRMTIVELSPLQFHEVLSSYTKCKSVQETRQWEESVSKEVISSAELIPKDHNADYYGDRAYCPLCKKGRNTFELPGYAYPEGLRRHLLGWGAARRCSVLEAASQIARSYWWHRRSTWKEEPPTKL